jgi:hypothetical protein
VHLVVLHNINSLFSCQSRIDSIIVNPTDMFLFSLGIHHFPLITHRFINNSFAHKRLASYSRFISILKKMISFSYPMQVYEECVHSSGLQFHIQILKRKMCPFSCPTQMFKKNVCILLGNTFLEQDVCICQHCFKENVCIFLPKHILRGMCTFPRASLTKYNSYLYTVILQKMGSFS